MFARLSIIALLFYSSPFSCSRAASGQAIKTTAEHPFYVPAQDRFVPAGELQVGDQLVSSQGLLVPIELISNLNEITTVHNLRVADHQTYFVGGALWGWDVWVHNASTSYAVGQKGTNALVDTVASEIESATTAGEAFLKAGRSGGNTWGFLYQRLKGSGHWLEKLAYGNAIQKITDDTFRNHKVLGPMINSKALKLNEGSVFGIRNKKSLRPDYQLDIGNGQSSTFPRSNNATLEKFQNTRMSTLHTSLTLAIREEAIMLHELETTAEVKQLRKRWNEEHSRQITEALVNCAGIPRVGCASMYQRGEVSYLDLRGAAISEFIKDAMVSNVDLSFCKNEGVGGASLTKLIDCRFINVNFSESIFAVDALNCDFRKCVFGNFAGKYENCFFVDAKFSRIAGVGVSFIRCDFRGTNMRMAHLRNCTFDNCLWDGCKLGFGSFCESTFIGSMPTPEQLGDFLMEDVVIQLD